MKNALFCLVIITLAGCFGKEPEITGHEGKSLPSFKLLLEDSATYFDTKNIPNGNPVVLFYFGPHCPYSKSQMEEIINNMESLKDVRFYVFTTWPFEQLKQFDSFYQLRKYPNIVTGIDFTNFFFNYFGAQGVPYIAIYGKDKKLRKAFIGKVNGKQIKDVAKN